MKEASEAQQMASSYIQHEQHRLNKEKQARKKQGEQCEQDWRQRLKARAIAEQVQMEVKCGGAPGHAQPQSARWS